MRQVLQIKVYSEFYLTDGLAYVQFVTGVRDMRLGVNDRAN
jgi:hypothetical protein